MTGRMTGDGDRAPRGERRAARQRARWDEPPPRDWRFIVGAAGKVLIATGVLMFGFVAYQLWGTGLEFAQAQDRLDQEFEDLLAAAPTTAAPTAAPTTAAPTTAPTTTAPTTTASDTPAPAPTVPSPTTVTAPPPDSTVAPTVPTTAAPTSTALPTTTVPAAVPVPDLLPGDVLARIEIPSIGLDAKVVAGVEPADLKEGPGHYPGTPMPGQLGNSAIAGHRTTYGEPFRNLDDIGQGEEIVITTIQGRFVYRMTGSEIVSPSDGQVVATTDPTRAKLTLTTCDPVFTATNRLIVYADLDTTASGQGLPPVLSYGGDDAPATAATLPGETVAGGSTSTSTSSQAPVPVPVPAATPPSVPQGTSLGANPTDTPGSTTEVTPSSAVATGDTGSEPPATLVPAGSPAAPTSGQVPATVDAFSHGWFSDDGAFPQVALWGLLLTALAVGSYLASRTARRNWVGALVGVAPFAMALYFFFQNINRLLPAAL